MRQAGLSLKQLLVVLLIIVALAALLFPVVQMVRYRALEAKCRANLWAIYMKYKMLKIQNNGRWDAHTARELERWLVTPEGLKVLFCPLSGEDYSVIATRPAWASGDPYLAATNNKFSTRIRKDIVAQCPCHTRPPRPRCGRPYVGPACELSVLDIGDGKIDYTFFIYTVDNRTNEIIWPREGAGCPDPKQFPDVSAGY